MPINGVPSDDWRVKCALGPYAEEMDEDEKEELQKTVNQKRKAALNTAEREDEDFKMPF